MSDTADIVKIQSQRECVNCVIWAGQRIEVDEFYEGIIMLTFREGKA